jgi:hypothetical protein
MRDATRDFLMLGIRNEEGIRSEHTFHHAVVFVFTRGRSSLFDSFHP